MQKDSLRDPSHFHGKNTGKRGNLDQIIVAL